MLVRAVVLLAFGGFASVLSLRASDPLLPLLGESFGILPGAASISITAFGIGYGLFQLLHGPLGDRIGKFRLISYLAALSAIGSFACAFAPSLATLVAARFFTGAMTGGMIPLALAWIGDTVPYEKRQVFIARYLLGNFIALTVGPAASGYLGEHFGWRTPFHIISWIYVVLTIVFWLEMRNNAMTREFKPSGSSLGGAIIGMGRLLHDRWVRTVLTAMVAAGVFLFAPIAFIPLHAQLQFGVGPGAAGQLLIAFAAGAISFSLASSQLLRRLGERGLIISGAALLVIGWTMFLLAGSLAAAALPVYVIAVGLFCVQNTVQVHGTQMAPNARGSAMALGAACLFLSQALCVALGGAVIDRFGSKPVFMFCAIGALAMALWFRRAVKGHKGHRV